MARLARTRSSAALCVTAVVAALLAAAAPSSAAAPQRTLAFERHAVDSAHTGKVRDLPRGDSDHSHGLKERENATFTQSGTPTASGTTTSTASSASTAALTTQGLNVKGLGLDDGVFNVRYAPPDTNGAVGVDQYVQSVNTQFAVYSKTTGLRVAPPFFGSTLFGSLSGAGAACATHDDGDPVVQYDKAAGRWILTQFQVTVTPYLECVAVSDTENATGSYQVYAYDYGNDFVDYPKVGVWPSSYDVTYNVFANGSTFTGGEVCALNRAALLAASAVASVQKCFRTSTTYAGLLPSDLDGTAAPPAADPDAYVVDMAGGRLYSWRLHVDWTGSTSALTGPTLVSGTQAFAPACSGGGTCIVQPGTQQKLDSLADRLMNRLAYRVVGGLPTLVVSHAITVGGNTKRSQYSGVRWYRLTPSGSGLQAADQGTQAPTTDFRWLSTAAMDKSGGIAVGYSDSSSTSFPSIRVASRLPGDPAGTLGTELVLQTGAGSQSGSNLARWGDYASMSVDPVDDCTLWFTTEYLTATGAFSWSTRIMSLKTGAC